MLADKSSSHPDSSKDPGKDGINNGFATDAFGMTLEYFPGDYSRSGIGITSLATATSKIYKLFSMPLIRRRGQLEVLQEGLQEFG